MDGFARSALNYLDESNDYVVPLVWSTWEMLESPGAIDRHQIFYDGVITPTAYFDGTYSFSEWDCNSMNFETAYNEIVASESPIDMNVSIEIDRVEAFELTASIEVTDEITTTNNKIFFVITNRVEYSLENPWYFLVVAKSDEMDMNLTTTGEMQTYSAILSVSMQEGWSLDDLYAVAIVQSFDSKLILQASQIQYQETGVSDPIPQVSVELYKNYPNPFNPSTTISYSLTQRSSVKLDVYNQKGQKITNLENSTKDAGLHQIVWNGNDSRGKAVPSGIYLYRFDSETPEGGRYTSVKKMILLK